MTRERSSRTRILFWLGSSLVAAALTFGVASTIGARWSARAVGVPAVSGLRLDVGGGNQGGNPVDCVVSSAKQLPNGSVFPICPKSFTIGGSISGLYPGATLDLPVTVSNPNNQDIKVTRITIQVTGTDKTGCTTSTSNLQPTNYTGPGFVVPRKSSRTIRLPIRMPSSVADACQNATFTLQYSGAATKP